MSCVLLISMFENDSSEILIPRFRRIKPIEKITAGIITIMASVRMNIFIYAFEIIRVF